MWIARQYFKVIFFHTGNNLDDKALKLLEAPESKDELLIVPY